MSQPDIDQGLSKMAKKKLKQLKGKISRPDQCDHMLKCCPKRSYGSFSLTEDFSKEAQEVNYYLGNFRKNFKKSPNLITLGQTFIFSEQNFNEKCELCVMRYWMK